MFCFWVTLSSGYLALYILMPSMLNHSSHVGILRSEEHTSELQSQSNVVCRLLLEKKNEDEPHAVGADRDQDVANRTRSVACIVQAVDFSHQYESDVDRQRLSVCVLLRYPLVGWVT